MATPISPVRIAHVTNAAVAIATTEEQEVDFELAVQQGVEIHQILTLPEVALDVTAAANSEDGHVSVHAETGALEDPEPAADGVVNNSEIIHHCLITGVIDTTANEPVAPAMIKNTKTNFWQRMNQPLLVASNLTIRYQTGTLMLSFGPVMTYITYRYVRLTEQELVNQLLMRR